HYGFPALFFMLLAFSWIILAVGSRRLSDQRLIAYRMAFVITMVTFFFVGCTVHFWDAAWVFFLFLLGSGVWILDAAPGRRDVACARVVRTRRPGSRQ